MFKVLRIIFLILNIQLMLSEKYDNEWDYVNLESGADPSVSAQNGGNGFEKIASSLGYQTLTITEEGEKLFGDSRAQKGGTLRDQSTRYPATMRTFGQESNYLENSIIESLCYESLLERHPLTYEPVVPRLATHWKISEDKQTFWFRINPNARFSDGRRVTADDAVATWFLLMDETILDPSQQVAYGKFEEPIAESMYILKVRSKEKNWENFTTFATDMYILPAHYVDEVDGTEFVSDWKKRFAKVV